MFIMLAGSSGVGKNTLINYIMKTNKEVALMLTLTTREMRPGEKQGNPFFFHSKEEFQEKIKNKELFEHELIHGNYYGSSRKVFLESLKENKVLMKDIGVEGAVNLSVMLKEYTNTIKVFLTTKNKRVLVKRLKERGEKRIKHRLKRFNYEQGEKYKFDFIIMNKTKPQTSHLLEEIIKNKNSLENYVFTKPVEKLNKKKINVLADEYKSGFMDTSIKVALKEGKIFILSGHEKFVASLIAGVTICKEVKENKKLRMLTSGQANEWTHYLNAVNAEIKQKELEKEAKAN